MLGRYTLSDLGIDIIGTSKQTLDTLESVLPAVKVASEDYIKISPHINTVVKFWPVVVTGFAIVMGASSAVGAYMVLKKLKKS